MADQRDQAPTRSAPVRAVVWIGHLALPVLGLWLLIAQPHLDVVWQDNPAHFWLVGLVAVGNVVLAALVDRAALRRRDARLLLVALAFLAGAGFLGLHALATPDVLVAPNAGFVLATPVGLLLAGVFAVASAARFTPEQADRIVRLRSALRGWLLAIVLAWGVVSMLGLPPLGAVLTAEQTSGYLGGLAASSVACYLIAAVAYWRAYRRRRSVMLLSVLTAFALLAEASVTVAVGHSWHLSWWLWHLLMAAGFGFVAYSAYAQYQREGAAAGLFDSVAADATVRQIREEYASALDTLVAALQRRERYGAAGDDLSVVTAGLAERFTLTDGQTAVLGRAAEALAAERDQLRRLNALVDLGQESSVIVSESDLLRGATRHITEGFDPDLVRVGLIVDGRLRYPEEPTATTPAEEILTLPLTVKGRPAGEIEVRRQRGRFDERDRLALRTLANQLSIGLENARLYQQIDTLFRQYMSPDVATALLADPAQAALGGAVVEVTALFADLRGFTTFSEQSSPEEIVAMLNRYFAVATECILSRGGTVVQFVGDALMALFNAPSRQPDHAYRAAAASLAMQAAIEPIVAERPHWPRFRVGVNTGPALVGNIGSEALRNFNAMGDAVNVAARLESVASPGSVVIGGVTRTALGERAEVEPLGALTVKGRQQPVPAFLLRRVVD
jgi:class 3 adenylate cyclase